MAQITNADFQMQGKSGRHYQFTAYTLNEKFNKGTAGIYVFTNYDFITNTHIKYIYCGQSGDLSERFDFHHQWKCISTNHANCIGVIFVLNPEDLDTYETDLLEDNSFTCNIQHQR